MIVRSKEYLYFEDGAINLSLVKSCIQQHEQMNLPTILKNKAYYANEQDIMTRTKAKGKANNKLAHAYPYYITTIASGYLLGSPVKYTAAERQDALEALLDAYEKADVDSIDTELARDASVCGKGVELLFSDEQTTLMSSTLNPATAFVVYDDTVRARPMFAVYYYPHLDIDGNQDSYRVHVYTDRMHYEYKAADISAIPSAERIVSEEHWFGEVPVIEYWNNEDEMGDFARVITLIDTYNTLQSDRVNDKEQFADAILVIWGCMMQDETDSEGNTIRTPAQQLREDRMLFLPDKDAGAQHLANTMSDSDTEVLKDSISADIHKLSLVPDLTDENFAANASGVAMKYKLFGLEQLTKIKERWFKEGLKTRLKCCANWLGKKGNASLDVSDVEITMTRALPANELEISQMVANLKDIVPDEILLGQIPFVKDAVQALEMLKKQKENETERQKQAFEVPFRIGENTRDSAKYRGDVAEDLEDGGGEK